MHSLTKEQRTAVLDKAKRYSNRRDYLMILIQFNHGLRAGELVRLTPDCLVGEILKVRRLKQRKAVVYSEHPLTAEERALLADWQPAADGTLFGICQRHYQRIFKEP
jgi:integrase